MSAALVSIPFHGDTLEAVRDVEGVVWINVKRICENLGIAAQGQATKLHDKKWACLNHIVATAADGKNYSMLMVDLESLPMWLATISPSKAKPAARQKLEQYQAEAKRVLVNHFLPKSELVATAKPATFPEPVVCLLLESVEALVRLQKETEAKVAALEKATENAGYQHEHHQGVVRHQIEQLQKFVCLVNPF
jgi:hypothetical protein